VNKHIELVKKWLTDSESVTQQELETNCESAEDAARRAEAVYEAADDDDEYAAAALAAANAAAYADAAAGAAYRAAAADAALWVVGYEEMTNKS